MPGIEKDNFVSRRVVVFFITCKEYIGTEIWEHFTYSMNEDIWFIQSIVDFQVFINPVVDIMDEVV
jgi:hypothetical protein